MIHATVSKLKIYEGDPIFDRIMEDFNASQEEGIEFLEINTHLLDATIRVDLMTALMTMGYDCGYSEDDEILEVWFN